LCDEPDSGLDPVRTAHRSLLLIDLNTEIDATILIVTHDIQIARTVPDNVGMLFRGSLALRQTGRLFALAGSVVRLTFRRPFQFRELVEQFWFIASVTILPSPLVAIPFGAVIALQVGSLARQLGAEPFTGGASVLAVVQQAIPLIVALLIAGAGGSSPPCASNSDLRALIIAAPRAATQVAGLLTDNDPDLGVMLANLLTTASLTITRQSALDELLCAAVALLVAALAAGWFGWSWHQAASAGPPAASLARDRALQAGEQGRAELQHPRLRHVGQGLGLRLQSSAGSLHTEVLRGRAAFEQQSARPGPSPPQECTKAACAHRVANNS
jgi:hypothetical protein